MRTKKEKDHALENGIGCCQSIKEMLAEVAKHAPAAGDYDSGNGELEASARQTIQESVLSVETRSGWRSPCAGPESDAEYCILLTTGGPACRIIGNLDRGQPTSAEMQIQDWGTPWHSCHEFVDYDADLLAFAGHFYFGE